jgi:hypothetical protein
LVVDVAQRRGGAGYGNILGDGDEGAGMRFRGDPIELNLRRAAARRLHLLQLQHTATIGSIVCLLLLALAVVMIRGWSTHRAPVAVAIALIVVGAFLAWMVTMIVATASQPKRPRLAAAVERVRPRLLDRLNTLVTLQHVRHAYPLRSYFARIERQAQDVLRTEQPRPTFSPTRPLAHLIVFGALLSTTVFVYDRYDPWERLRSLPEVVEAVKKPEPPIDMALPEASALEQKKNWGEVRISEPGHDMRVTKVDAIPLQIEAAADQSLKEVKWSSAINGAKEEPHALPPPAEPRYAVYQPVLYMDEFHLADWDVMTYYAKAATEGNNSYGSEIYFLEVRPFREDILKMLGGGGGGGGKCYDLLAKLTELIQRQQHIIRETHHYVQSAPDAQDRAKLALAETDLADAARHLYAEVATRFENAPIGEVLDHLAQAESWLKRAGSKLADDFLPEAQSHERTALTELVATRKIFQKKLIEYPDAFKDAEDEESSPITESSKKLRQVEEFRNETKAAQEFVKKTMERQQDIAKRANTASPKTNLANEQSELAKSLKEFQEQHPEPFRAVTNEVTEAQSAMRQSEDALKDNKPTARRAPAQAADKLQKLHDALQEQSLDRQLTAAYKLKQLLDDQIGQCEELGEKPGALKPDKIKELTVNAERTTGQLKQIAEQPPTRDAFGPPLRDALADDRKRALDSQLDTLAQAQGDDATKQAAKNAAEALSRVSKAFGESQPRVAQQLGKSDPLKDSGRDGLERGLSLLQSLLTQLENNHHPSPENEGKQRGETLYLLRDSIRELYGDDERSETLVALLEEELNEKTKPLDPIAIKKLMDEIKNFSIEVSDARHKPDEPEVTHIDPSRLPPAYRARIERYFRKLSEQ